MPPNSWESLVLEFSLCPQSHCTSFIGSDNCYGFLIPSCRQYKKGFLVSGQYFDHCQKQWRNLCSSLNDEKLVILGDFKVDIHFHGHRNKILFFFICQKLKYKIQEKKNFHALLARIHSIYTISQREGFELAHRKRYRVLVIGVNH